MSVLLIPALGDLLEGVEWNVTMNQSDSVQSDVTQYPIDDVERPYLVDFNQNKPATINLTLIISVHGEVDGSAVTGSERLQQCYERLLELKHKQTTTPNALIDVMMGHTSYQNMAIVTLDTTRKNGHEGWLEVDLSLQEFQFVSVPQVDSGSNVLDSNTSKKNDSNQPMHETRDTGHPRVATGDENDTAILSGERKRGAVRPRTAAGVAFEIVRKNMGYINVTI